jgi:outer membrane protein TolC
MNNHGWNLRRIAARVLTGLALPCLVSIAMAEDPEPLAQPAKAPVVVAPKDTLTELAAFRQMALETQPALAAYRASASAAEAKEKSLDDLRFAAIIRHDLPTRRKQAAQGVIASHAQLRKAEHETLYAVTRTYFSVLYARQQLALADRALESPDKVTSLRYLRQVADKINKDESRRDVRQWHVDQVDLLITTTAGRREEAAQGVLRAEAALREAIGLEADCPLTIDPNAKLPSPKPVLSKDVVVSLALQRRSEIVQSSVGFEVTSLEIDAQKRICGPRGETFGAGSDIHADAVPQGIANGDYRPGAITIEMPTQLVGSRKNRIEQAEALQGRAAAVMDKTRHLVTLEAEDAYYRWVEASREAEEFTKAAELAEKIADRIRNDFVPGAAAGTRPNFDDLTDSRVRAVQLRLQANTAHYRALLALAALERVTAGGVSPIFDAPGSK